MSAILTGYKQFDTLAGGLLPADVLTIVTSPANDGISLALSIVLHIASTSLLRVGLLGLAMNRHQITQSLLAMRAGVERHHLRTGQLKADEWQRVKAAANELSRINLWIDDPADLQAIELHQRSHQLVDAHRVSLIIIDDISLLLSGTVSAPFERRRQGIGEVGQWLRALARELCVPVIACAPLAQPVKYSWRRIIGRDGLPRQFRTEGAEHFLFLSVGGPPRITHTGICAIFLTQECSGLVTELALSSQPGIPF